MQRLHCIFICMFIKVMPETLSVPFFPDTVNTARRESAVSISHEHVHTSVSKASMSKILAQPIHYLGSEQQNTHKKKRL